ncbi:hypothetical protein BU17DRAFT_68358 [Hysterangium stoloniferum]|nr:hypothetical protein BU17DRAFT_68358 [Hysterangium stoloniferum]
MVLPKGRMVTYQVFLSVGALLWPVQSLNSGNSNTDFESLIGAEQMYSLQILSYYFRGVCKAKNHGLLVMLIPLPVPTILLLLFTDIHLWYINRRIHVYDQQDDGFETHIGTRGTIDAPGSSAPVLRGDLRLNVVSSIPEIILTGFYLMLALYKFIRHLHERENMQSLRVIRDSRVLSSLLSLLLRDGVLFYVMGLVETGIPWLVAFNAIAGSRLVLLLRGNLDGSMETLQERKKLDRSVKRRDPKDSHSDPKVKE